MSSPPHGWQGSSSLPPNPYGPPDDILSRSWLMQSGPEYVRADLSLPGRVAALPVSSQGHRAQLQSSLQTEHARKLELARSRHETMQRELRDRQKLQRQDPQVVIARIQADRARDTQMRTALAQATQMGMQNPQMQTSQMQLHSPRMQPPQGHTPQVQTLPPQAARIQAAQLQTPQAAIAQIQADRGQAPQMHTRRMQTPQMKPPQGQTPQIQAVHVQAAPLQAPHTDTTQAAVAQIMASRAHQAQIAQAQAARGQASQFHATRYQATQVQASNENNRRITARNFQRSPQEIAPTPARHMQAPVKVAQHAQAFGGNGAHAGGQQTQLSRNGVPLEQSFRGAGARVIARDVHPSNRGAPHAQVMRGAGIQAGLQYIQPPSQSAQLVRTGGAGTQHSQFSRNGALLQQPFGGVGAHANAQRIQSSRSGVALAQHVGGAGIFANNQETQPSRNGARPGQRFGGAGVHATAQHNQATKGDAQHVQAVRGDGAQAIAQHTQSSRNDTRVVQTTEEAGVRANAQNNQAPNTAARNGQTMEGAGPDAQRLSASSKSASSAQAMGGTGVHVVMQQTQPSRSGASIDQTGRGASIQANGQQAQRNQRSKHEILTDITMRFAAPTTPEPQVVDGGASNIAQTQGGARNLDVSKKASPEAAAPVVPSQSSRTSQANAGSRAKSPEPGDFSISPGRLARKLLFTSVLQPKLLHSSEGIDSPLDDGKWEPQPDLSHVYHLETSDEMISSPLDVTPRKIRERFALDISAESRSAVSALFNFGKRRTYPNESARKRHKAIEDRVDDFVMDIVRKPAAQRPQEFAEMVETLGMLEPERSRALDALRWELSTRKKDSEWPILFKKWLSAMFRHSLNDKMEAEDMAGDVGPAEQVAPFCSKELHTLKCGHQSPSGEECGMNCYGSTHLDDVRLAVIKCVVCSKEI